jgi:leader peptidase (prepilin peptidase)/N-methyltransferase
MDIAIMLQLLILCAILTVISVVDLKTQTIPDSALVLLALAGLGFQWMAASALEALISALFYFLIFWLVRKAHYLTTRRTGLGFGDVKMAGAAGLWISIGAAPLFIGIASVTALFSVGAASVVTGAAVLRQRIPFAPFLALSLLVCWILGINNFDMDDFYAVFSIA